jgi:prepilin-type N-terminal cleavage/methylation domain-containing protein
MRTIGRRPPRRLRGFTLLEVLAAVAVLAIVYTSLARAAMQGLANQGDASRRLRASMLADEALGQIEALLAAGTAPPVGESELPSEDPDFAIAVEVRPFEDVATALAAAAAPEAGELAGRAAPGEAEREKPLELLVAAPGGAPPLLEIAVRVRWVEGALEQEVTRASFAADPAIVATALAALKDEGGDAAGEDDDDESDTGQEVLPPESSGGELPFPANPRDTGEESP